MKFANSYGERAVGLSFNPSGNEGVERIKRLYAEIIDFCNDARTHALGEQARLFSVAITEAQAAQMWAVKAITWNTHPEDEVKEQEADHGQSTLPLA
jgi:hypothetical protein